MGTFLPRVSWCSWTTQASSLPSCEVKGAKEKRSGEKVRQHEGVIGSSEIALVKLPVYCPAWHSPVTAIHHIAIVLCVLCSWASLWFKMSPLWTFILLEAQRTGTWLLFFKTHLTSTYLVFDKPVSEVGSYTNFYHMNEFKLNSESSQEVFALVLALVAWKNTGMASIRGV